MRYFLAAAACLHWAATSAAFDSSRVLLSDHIVLCSPRTPVAAAKHLVETWGALLCVVSTTGDPMDVRLSPWVALPLVLGDGAHVSDSLSAWRAGLYAGTAVISDDPELARAAQAAGLRVFVQTSEFRPGGLALPGERGYLYYDGPSPVFFDRPGRLLQPSPERSLPERPWADLALALEAAFSGGSGASQRSGSSERADLRWSALVSAAHSADSLARLAGAPAWARAYAERWRLCLDWWLSPAIHADTLVLFAGQEKPHTIELTASGGRVVLEDVRTDAGNITATWNTPWPLELAGGTVKAEGLFRAARPGRYAWTGHFAFRFADHPFERRFTLPVTVDAALSAVLVPPVLCQDGPYVRNDPDFDVRSLSGQLELQNGSSESLSVRLVYRTEQPLHVSATAADLVLAPGDRKRAGFTLTVPKDAPHGEYEFAIDLVSAGTPTSVRGQVWKNTPRKSGRGRLAVAGTSGPWLSALSELGLKVSSVEPGSLSQKLREADAFMLRGGTSAGGAKDLAALSDFVATGGVAILELDRDALEWLPWRVNTVRRPAPFAASFYRENLSLWQAPNPLVGGCFAAAHRDTVLTLAAGEGGWEPLVVDDHGKGFMYRRPSGRGWYVLVHAGWWPRLERIERRALLGLFNLVGSAAK